MNVHTIAYITYSYLYNDLKQNTCGKAGEYFMINDDMCICLHQHTCTLGQMIFRACALSTSQQNENIRTMNLQK